MPSPPTFSFTSRGTSSWSFRTIQSQSWAASLMLSRRGGDPFDLLWAEVEEIQRFVADLPDRDSRSPEEILGYDERGLPG